MEASSKWSLAKNEEPFQASKFVPFLVFSSALPSHFCMILLVKTILSCPILSLLTILVQAG